MFLFDISQFELVFLYLSLYRIYFNSQWERLDYTLGWFLSIAGNSVGSMVADNLGSPTFYLSFL